MRSILNYNDLDRYFKNELLQQTDDICLDRCLTCGTCTGGCPASGLMDMDPKKFLRMVAYRLDKEVKTSEWAWVCTMCARCVNSCPMKINIPKLVFKTRASWPRNECPKGIRGSCDNHIKSGNAMGCNGRKFFLDCQRCS